MTKRYLDVSYDDRELAKRLGAKWDPSVRRWYCPAGSPLAKIFKWRAEAQATIVQASKREAERGQPEPQSKRVKNDIRYKPASVLVPSLKKQPAVNQNFELFMAS
ncbi:MAG: DUF5710 domain-containing protein [Litorimonas sp.]